MQKIKQIITPRAPLFKTKNIDDLVETECLFGEKFIVKKELKEWSFGILCTDDYEGWVEKKYLGDFWNLPRCFFQFTSTVLFSFRISLINR